jgi:hypothetical protein
MQLVPVWRGRLVVVANEVGDIGLEGFDTTMDAASDRAVRGELRNNEYFVPYRRGITGANREQLLARCLDYEF